MNGYRQKRKVKKVKLLLTIGSHTFMIILAIFMLFPILWAFITALTPQELIMRFPPIFFSEEFSFYNFGHAFQAQNLPRAAFNTFFLSTVTATISAALSMLAAYAFSRYSFKGKSFLYAFLIVPMLIPGLTNLIPLFSVFTRLRLDDTYLGLVLLYIPGTVPFATIVMKNFFDSLPAAVEEAGLIDGCSRFSVIWRVVLPVVLPGASAIFIINFVTIWNDFLITLIFTRTNEMRTLTLTIFNMIGVATVRHGPLSATAFMTLLPALAIFLIFRKRFISTMLDGAIKG
jgi:ABC-type glycerol-3-phosphate transport system permease component